MRTMSKKLMSIATTVAVSVSVLSNFGSVKAAVIDKETIAEKSTAAETDGIYSTNGTGFGKKKTISIDGDFSDWSEDMLVAQGAACDTATRFKGVWENWVMDTYSVYGAWDDENLYVAWQNVNTYDTFWEQDGNGPLSDGGKCGDAPVLIALDTGKGNAMTGRMADGKGIWGIDVEFETRVDNILAIHSNLTGTPGLFKGDSSGASSYAATDGLLFDFKEQGIEVEKIDDCFPSKIMGVWNPGDENDKASYDLSSNWVDLKTTTLGVRPHDTKYDTFYEMKIPFSALGITKEDVETYGVGVMQLISRGESGMDCVPHDPSMLDNTYGDYGAEPSNSHEKDDKDIITVPLAKIGNGDGPTPPPVENGTVKVKYVDENGTEIAPSKTLTGNVGASYTTTAATVDGYTLKETPSNATGKYTSSTITVTYVYSENGVTPPPVEEGTVIVKYVDEAGNEIAPQVTKTGEVGTSYTATAKTISGYTLIQEPSNATGTYKTSTITVTYVYSEDGSTPPANAGTVTVKYVNYSTGETIKSSTTITGDVGTSYTTTAATISGYSLTELPYNANGTFRDGNIIVTYYYVADGQEETPLTINSFTADKQSPQASGTKITLKATASGVGTLQYKFFMRDAQGNYYVIRDYSTSNTVSWTPGAVGNKTLYVKVKDSTGKEVNKAMAYTVKSSLTVSSFTADKVSPQASGTKITLKATATGTGLQYKFLMRDDKGNYYVIRNYSTSNTASWTPIAVGNKMLYVKVKDSTGKEVTKAMAYTVKSSLTVSSFTADKASPQAVGTKVTLKATATGTGLQYKFFMRDAKGNYYIIRNYATSNTVAWTPGAVGTKTLYVDAKDSTGKVVRKEMVYTVKNAIVEETNTGIYYTGAWATAKGTNYSAGSCKYAQNTASATYKFTGTGIKVIGNKASTSGIAKITIDGNVYYVDLYNATTTCKNLIFAKSGLKLGTHTIKVEWTGLKNGASKGTTVNLDAFEIIE